MKNLTRQHRPTPSNPPFPSKRHLHPNSEIPQNFHPSPNTNLSPHSVQYSASDRLTVRHWLLNRSVAATAQPLDDEVMALDRVVDRLPERLYSLL